MPVEVGKIIEGVVSGITSFGAFIQLPEGKTGMVHISEVADSYVKDIHMHLKEKDRVKVKVLSVDNNGKISLSIRKANERKAFQGRKSSNPVEFNWDSNRHGSDNLSFEDRLSKFFKDSEEKLQDIKRNREAKRGGGFSRRSSEQYY